MLVLVQRLFECGQRAEQSGPQQPGVRVVAGALSLIPGLPDQQVRPLPDFGGLLARAVATRLAACATA
jgi:hypothetical protein